MKRIFYTLSLIALTFGVHAQTLLNENFDYSTGQLTSAGSGANVSSGNWSTVSGTAFYVPVVSGGLSYPSYLSNSGNKISLISSSTSAEDVSRSFSSTSTGSVYTSVLLEISDTVRMAANGNANGDYFLTYNPSTFFSRLSVKKGSAGNTYTLGIRHSSSATTVWSSIDLAVATTHLIIIKYTFVSGSTNDNSALFINPILGAVEPTADAISTNVSTGDPSSLSAICLRQGNAGTPNGFVDGIRIGTAWFNGALPVNYKSFNIIQAPDANILRWTTASESNNSHFDVQRSVDGKNYETIAKVKGNGNSSKVITYQYSDNAYLTAKTIYYRLKQVDFDGKFELSKTISVSNTLAKPGISATLPNPFNDELSVTVSSATATTAKIELMDMIGKLHHTATEQLVAGNNIININTTDMPDGIYFVRLNYNGETFTQKVIKK